MTQWEYKVDKSPFPYSAESLNAYFGRHGWELCGVCEEYNAKAQMTSYIYTFKKPYKSAYGKMLDEIEGDCSSN